MEVKLLPKPSFQAYLAEYSRTPQKMSQYVAGHPSRAVFYLILWYLVLSVFALPKIVPFTRFALPVVSFPSSSEQQIQPSSNNAGSILLPTPTELPPTPTPTPLSLVPVELSIPKLNVKSTIEQVGQTKTYEMDVPKKAANVAWYVYGAKPGEVGNAVINGHYDTPSGKPAVFYNLKNLVEGDEIFITSEDGVKQTFVVKQKESTPYQSFPSEYVFFTKPGKNVNLITCNGVWNVKDHIYNERLVVYTQLKEGGDSP